jgi:hypothetical protein
MSELGQNRKSSLRANVFRCSPNNGHCQDTSDVRFAPTAAIRKSEWIAMSAFHPETDIAHPRIHVSFVLLPDSCSAAKTSISRIGGWPRPMLRGATPGDRCKFCKVPAANADKLAGKLRQDADRCLKVPRIMPLLELLQRRFQRSAGLANPSRSEIK